MKMKSKEKPKKFVYEDSGHTKVVRGYIQREDEFTYQILIIDSSEMVVIGKRGLIKVGDV
jgi:hypothetical protein